MTGLSDSFQRPINYLRISVTDRCNLRCIYCMPSGEITYLPRGEVLRYEEIQAVAQAAASLGINKLRLTGGEPLVRAELTRLVHMLSHIDGIDDIALTTNGVLLRKHASSLRKAGLKRVNVSLDTLKRDKYKQNARRDRLGDVLDGITAAKEAGLEPVKVNMVVMRGINDDEVLDFRPPHYRARVACPLYRAHAFCQWSKPPICTHKRDRGEPQFPRDTGALSVKPGQRSCQVLPIPRSSRYGGLYQPAQ